MAEPPDLSRRTFVIRASATGALAAAPMTFATVSSGNASPDLLTLSAVEAVNRMTRGDMTVESYASALLARCGSLRALNVWITLEPDKVLSAARACDLSRRAGRRLGPLFGLPIPIKDSVNTQEYPTTGGTAALRNFRPAEDAPLVRQLKEHGAMVLGKTNLHEMSFGWTSNNLPFGAVHNPYDPTRIPGGSSGGTAVAVATCMAPLGIAEDTCGSIRVPAAMCGIAGFRPTTGRYSTQGVIPLAPAFDQIGPVARRVSDLVFFDSIIANDKGPLAAAPLKGLRLGIVRDYWFKDLDPEVEKLTDLAFQRLRDKGVEIVETALPRLGALVDLTIGQIVSHDASRVLTKYLTQYQAQVTFEELLAQASPEIRKDYQDALPGGSDFVSEASYAAARDIHLPELRRAYRDYFARTGVAAIVYPVTMVPATTIGEEAAIKIGAREISLETALSRNITPSSTAGIPGLVLPCGVTKGGLPVALEFDAPSHSDRGLLALGLQLESALGPIPQPKM